MFNIVPRTDHNTALTIDHTIIHKTDHTIGQHKYNTKINEIDDLSDCSPDCSDKSDCEDYCTDHETQEVEDPKN